MLTAYVGLRASLHGTHQFVSIPSRRHALSPSCIYFAELSRKSKTAGRGKPAAVRDGTVLRKAKTESGGSLIEQEGLAVDQSPDDVFISNLFVLFMACDVLQGFLELFGCGSGCRGEEEQFGNFFSIRSGITGE